MNIMNMFFEVFVLSLLGWTMSLPVTQDSNCVCFTTNAVNIYSAPCGSQVLSQASSGQCTVYLGKSVTCEIYGTPWTFLETDIGWVSTDFLSKEDDSICSRKKDDGPSWSCDLVEIVPRSGWGARSPRGTSWLSLPLQRVVLHHSDTSPCFTRNDCSARMRAMQNHHMDVNRWNDIGYNWCVGEDGRAYEGRGWDFVGAHAAPYNNRSFGICMIGNFQSHMANLNAQRAFWRIIDCGVRYWKLLQTYTIAGHRDLNSTACPGNQLYSWLRTQPQYSPFI